MGVGVGVAELTQHNPPGTALPHPGTVLGPRPRSSASSPPDLVTPQHPPGHQRLRGVPVSGFGRCSGTKLFWGRRILGAGAEGAPGVPSSALVPCPQAPGSPSWHSRGVTSSPGAGVSGREISPTHTHSHNKPTAGAHVLVFFPTFILKVIIEA